MITFSNFLPVARISLARFLLTAIGFIVSTCISLPTLMSVKTLRSSPVTLDSTGVVFALRSGVTDGNEPSVCLVLDSLRYTFRPEAKPFHPGMLTDTTVYPRNVTAPGGTPIAFRAVLEGNNGERARFQPSGYGFNQNEGYELCLGAPELVPGVSYVRLRLRSTRPIIVERVTWHTRNK